MSWLIDEMVAAAEIVSAEVMAFTGFLYEEGEVVAECLMEAAAWLNGVVIRVAEMSF